MCAIASPNYQLESSNSQTTKRFTLKDLIGDGMLWAVPKTRRTLEKRQKRKFGVPGRVYKMLLPKPNLRSCIQCGHDHELGVLCRKFI